MMTNNKDKNPSIQCVVEECKYHATMQITVHLIQLVTSTASNSQTSRDTECGSFIAKS